MRSVHLRTQKTRAMVRAGYLDGAPAMPMGDGARQSQGVLSGPALQALKLKVVQAMIVWDLVFAKWEQDEQTDTVTV